MAWSQYQLNIFDFVKHGTGSAVVEAVAGSGKTTTMVEAQKSIMTRSNIFLAFNKSIAEELKARGVNARTFHSLTYSPVTRHKGVRDVTSDKLNKLLKKNLNGDDFYMYATFVSRLVGLGKQVGIGCLVPDTQQTWVDIVTYHDLELENEEASLGRAIDLAASLLQWSNESEMVDFDDLLYIPVKEGLVLQKFDFVFVDEAQDTNAIQRALIRKILNPNSRVIAVGDPAQAIYGFRGADSDSLALVARDFHCQRLPLTVSYRCPTSVIAHAQQWVKHIEAAPNAPEGEVLDMGEKWKLTDFVQDDLIVCRTTKPLIVMAFKFFKAKIPARIMGRDIGQGLKSLINKLDAGNIDNLIEKLDAWAAREIEKAIVKDQEQKAETIRDKAEVIMVLIEGLSESSRSISELLFTIDKLFADSGAAVVLATIHKSKGLEADRVFWLNSSKCPASWAKQPWQQQQERNLCYVATTRAKKALYLIEEKTSGNDEQ